MRSRLGYLHMPKAAGTSIRAAFASYYDQVDTVPYSFDRHLFGDDPRIDEVSEPLFLGEPDGLAALSLHGGSLGVADDGSSVRPRRHRVRAARTARPLPVALHVLARMAGIDA